MLETDWLNSHIRTVNTDSALQWAQFNQSRNISALCDGKGM